MAKQSKINDFEYNLIDSVYDFKGLWNRDSKCGLKIVKLIGLTTVIVTELYNDNPGSSVTEFCAELATLICREYSIDFKELTFIVHIPEINSKLDFYEESFDKVVFEVANNTLTKPDFIHVTRQEVVDMIGG